MNICNNYGSHEDDLLEVAESSGALCDALIPRVLLTTRQPTKNLWISGAPISHSHVSYIETHSYIFKSQYTKIYDRL